MQPESQTDHIALLALMLCGNLIRRMEELGQLDPPTVHHLHHLVKTVRAHAQKNDITDLGILFDNIDRALGHRKPAQGAG